MSINNKSWFLKKMNKIDKPLARFNKKGRTQINEITNDTGDITASTRETQRIMRLL